MGARRLPPQRGAHLRLIRTAPAAAVLSLALVGPAGAQDTTGPTTGTTTGDTISTGAASGNPSSQAPAAPTDPNQATPANAGGSQTFSPPPECRYRYWMSGPEMAAYAATFVVPMFPAPANGWEAHATDLMGAWYEPRCEFTSGLSPDRLEERAIAFYAANPPVWAMTEPPPPPIPVVDLVEVVRDSRRLPALVVSTNPAAETVVGLRTWVWPTGGDFGPVTSRAESGPNWAQVTATPGRLSLVTTDAGAEVGDCATTPAWSRGVADDATDCYVTFRRSSAGRPGSAHTVSVQMTWEVRLTTSDGRDELLASPPVVTDVAVPVAQVQSVVG